MGNWHGIWVMACALTVTSACSTSASPPASSPRPASPDDTTAPSSASSATTESSVTLAPTTYEVQTETVEARPVLQVHVEVAPSELSARFAEVFGEIYPYVAQQGATPSGTPYGCYHDFTPERVVVDIGVPVSQPLAAHGDLQPAEQPSGPIAFTTHTGSYQHLQRAHDAVKQWVEQHGRHVQGAPCDFYEVGPGQATDERDYRTRVVYWLEP